MGIPIAGLTRELLLLLLLLLLQMGGGASSSSRSHWADHRHRLKRVSMV